MLLKTKLPPSYRCREAVKPMDLLLFISNNSIFLSCPFQMDEAPKDQLEHGRRSAASSNANILGSRRHTGCGHG